MKWFRRLRENWRNWLHRRSSPQCDGEIHDGILTWRRTIPKGGEALLCADCMNRVSLMGMPLERA